MIVRSDSSSPFGTLSIQDLSLLIVEDVEESRRFLSSFLNRHGATVYTAKNGRQGLDLFNMYKPDIVISDIRMPLLDGLDMVAAIREHHPDTPVVILTAHTDVDMLQRSIDMEATQYLVKPINSEKLISALSKVIAKLKSRHAIQSQLQSLHEQDSRLDGIIRQLLGTDTHLAVKALQLAKDKISGDFFSIEECQRCLYVLLADGMGHGPTAIVPAINLPKSFRQMAKKGFSLSRIADELNQILIDQRLVEHFVTATLLRIDVERQLLETINCGNPAVLICDLHGQVLASQDSNHLPLGIVGGDDFLPELQSYHYRNAINIYLFSDGLTDTLQHLERMPGIDVVIKTIGEQPEAVVETLDNFVHNLTPEQRQDDITLLEIGTPLLAALPSKDEYDGPIDFALSQLTAKTSVLANSSLLYVEDDDETRQHLARFLGRRVGALYVASDGEEALKLFKRYRPRLVLADVILPGMNGLELTEAIRTIDSNAQIILTSGVNSWQNREGKLETLLDLAINKFLPKPVTGERLLETIQNCLDQYDEINNLHMSASVFITSPLAMTVTDANRNIIAVNPAFTTITGYSEEEVLGCNPRILGSGRHDSFFYKQMWQAMETTNNWSGEIWNRRKSGELFLEWINITCIRDDTGKITHYASVFSDITQRAVAEEKIRHLAHHDALTNLPNRVLLYDRLGQALLQAQREQTQLAVVYLDVDHFKNVNDTMGHTVGDELICIVATALQQAIRETDTVCRLGGDEFAILLPDVGSAEMAGRLVGKIFSAASRSYQVANKDLRIGISMGISLYPRDGETIETLIKRADSAMYLAKKKGRNNYQFFDLSLEQHAERQMAIQQGLHKALKESELVVHYQPKFDVVSRRIVGVEALLRWNSPELGDVSPSEFIPIAEETGFIIEIGNWVIEQVCHDIADWQANGVASVTVAINISPIQFHRGNLQRNLLQNLTKYRLPHQSLQIELTEGIVMSSHQNTLAQLQAIKDMGITISIDDFGTGYSSLSYLRKLPIDELKIDRSFIMEIIDQESLNDSRLIAIPSAIIELARKLKLKLVAEGVETRIQSDFLQNEGCHVIQGYLFSKPIDKQAMAELLSQYTNCGD